MRVKILKMSYVDSEKKTFGLDRKFGLRCVMVRVSWRLEPFVQEFHRDTGRSFLEQRCTNPGPQIV